MFYKINTSKSDIANFVKKTDFNYKRKNVFLKKKKKKELIEPSKKTKAISTKGLTKQNVSLREYFKII